MSHYVPVIAMNVDRILGFMKPNTCTLDSCPFGLLNSCEEHINNSLMSTII